MSSTTMQSYGALRRKPGLVLTDRTMRAVAADLPPMGGGFPQRLIKRAASLEISHARTGEVSFTLKCPADAVLGEVCFHPADDKLPGSYRAPRQPAASPALAVAVRP